MKHALIALALLAAPATAFAADTAATGTTVAKPAFSTADTDIGTLIDNSATKAILVKYMPEMVNSPQIDMARPMTLRQVQTYAPDKITDEVLAKIDVDLAAVPAPK